jgi:3-dehydroquinate synthetase
MGGTAMMRVAGVESQGRRVTSVFENAHDFPCWKTLTNRRTLVLADQAIWDHPLTVGAVSTLRKTGDLVAERLVSGEQIKQQAVYTAIANKYGKFRPDHVVMIGGGTLLNLGTYLATDFVPRQSGNSHDGNLCTAIPTNTMSMADVALGGLGLLNAEGGEKNAYRRKRDPDSIFLFLDYVSDAPAELRREGVVEVLKHCILQRRDLIEPILRLYLEPEPDAVAAFDAAKLGLMLKSEVLELGGVLPEDDIEFLLSYGHLHAHVIEERWGGQIPHSPCVFVGLLLDLTLSDFSGLCHLMIDAARSSPLGHKLRKLMQQDLIGPYLMAYPHHGRFFASSDWYYVTDVNEDNAGRIVAEGAVKTARRKVDIGAIKGAYDSVARALG